MTSKERKERKAVLMNDLRAFHQKLRTQPPLENGEERREDLAEVRRLIREKSAVGLSEREYLEARNAVDGGVLK